MKKTFYEQLSVFAISMLAVAIVYTIIGAGLWGVVDAVTDCVIYTAFILMVDDVAFKYFRYRRLLCWEYWVGFCLEALCVGTFAFASRTSSIFAMCAGLVLCACFGVGIYLWDSKVFNFIEFDENNLKIEQDKVILRKARKNSKKELKSMREVQKAFQTMDEQQIKETLYGTLKYRFVEDDISKDIIVSDPLFDKPIGTYKELSELGAEYNSTASAVKEYVDYVVGKYIEKRNNKDKE